MSWVSRGNRMNRVDGVSHARVCVCVCARVCVCVCFFSLGMSAVCPGVHMVSGVNRVNRLNRVN